MRDGVRPVLFLSDFGASEYPGICRAVIASIAPEVPVIDLSHHVPPFDVAAGALVAMDAAPYAPPGSVWLAVVDPGVGGGRRAVVVLAARGDLLVGPDNGLLMAAAAALGGVKGAWSLENPAYRLPGLSSTFHGRDLFAPAAAHLAKGLPPEAMGPPVEPESLLPAPLPEPRLEKAPEPRLIATVILFDPFGSARLRAPARLLGDLGLAPGRPARLAAGGRSWRLPVARTFGDVPEGAALLLEDSSGDILVAVHRGSARRELGLQRGQEVEIAPLRGGV
ncbi:MAG: SAM-dependent chlorinase/fluorinase [Bacillota bacterium]|nr:SAM-dependent chlorinase/fluorinase [Bacillota bacterium]